MNRQEHLQFCKVCTHKKFDRYKGVVCDLTNERADFDPTCPNFEEDTNLDTKRVAMESNIHRPAYTNKGTRFSNYIIDLIALVFLQYTFAFMLGIFLGLISPDTVNSIADSGRLFDYILGAIFSFLYYTFFEHAYGQSIGKMLTKTKVVNLKGEKPSLETIAKRSLCRLVPFNAFSFLGDTGTGWHDSWSNTRVIPIPKETQE